MADQLARSQSLTEGDSETAAGQADNASPRILVSLCHLSSDFAHSAINVYPCDGIIRTAMAEDESSAVENNGNRPIFAGKGKRSRKGCLTCTQSKVKCSERHPICDRCSRTRRQCVWPGTKPSLQIRRRGAGPYKDRAMMNPRPIVPDAQPPVQTTSPQDGTPVTTSNFSNHQKATSSYAEMHVTDEFQSHFPSTPWVEAESAVALLAAVPKVASDQGMYQRITLPSPTASSSLAAHIHSRSSVIIGRPEWEALQFFEGVFARVYSPKPFTWSHLGVISHFGKQDGAVQHLIVATCLGQLDKTSSDGAFWRLGKKHFQTGAQLVIQEIKKSELDHCKIFIAFWLLQVTYNTYWGDKAAESLSKLSLAMAQYVRKHQLLDTFKAKNPSNYSREALGMVTDKERSLLARLLIFSLYEDIDADFCHAGGAFAAELCSDPSVITAVYLPSKDCLSHYFGPMYPHEELMDDVQRSNLLELHFEANMTLQTINAASNNNAPRSEFEKIARRMEDLKLVWN